MVFLPVTGGSSLFGLDALLSGVVSLPFDFVSTFCGAVSADDAAAAACFARSCWASISCVIFVRFMLSPIGFAVADANCVFRLFSTTSSLPRQLVERRGSSQHGQREL